MNDDPVVPLGRTPPPEPPPRPSRPRTLHGISMAVMVMAGILTVLSAIAFITVTWSGYPRRIVIATILFGTLIFLAAASASFLTAARDTYAIRPESDTDGVRRRP